MFLQTHYIFFSYEVVQQNNPFICFYIPAPLSNVLTHFDPSVKSLPTNVLENDEESLANIHMKSSSLLHFQEKKLCKMSLKSSPESEMSSQYGESNS